MAREESGSQQDLTAAFDAFSLAALKTMARRLGVKARSEQRAAYVAALASAAGTSEHRTALERQLEAADWDLLNLLPTRFGPFRLRVLLVDAEKPGSISEDRLRSTANLFASACLVPAGQLRPGSPRLGIDQNSILSLGLSTPLVVIPGVSDWARQHNSLSLPLPLCEAPERISGSTLPDLQRAVFVILTESDRKPIRLTQQGQPYKSDLRALAAQVVPAEGRKVRTNATPVPPLTLFALAALRGAGLLVERKSELQPAARSKEFFSAPPERQAQMLVDGWYESRFKDFLLIRGLNFGWGQDLDTPWFRNEEAAYDAYAPRQIGVAVARRCITAAVAEGVAEAADGWYPIADVARSVFLQYPEMLFPRLDEYFYSGVTYLNPPQRRRAYMSVYRTGDGVPMTPGDAASRTLYQDSDWMEVEGAFVREEIAGPMRWLGLTEVGPDPDEPDRFHLTELGQQILCGRPPVVAETASAGRRAVIQPNYEVIVLDAARNLDLLSQLDAFAERRSLDRAATYRLTQTALARGLDRGWTGTRVLKALEAANNGPLPQNVRYSLEEWIRLYESLSLHEATCLLEADDAAQLDGWLADPALAKLLGDRLGPATVRISPRQLNALLGQIRRPGSSVATVDYAVPLAGVLELKDPDEILLDGDRAEPYLRYQLEAFSEPAGEARTHLRYRITEASVRRAVKLGWREPQLRGFLNLAAKKGLPPDFSVRLSGWSALVPAAKAETLVAVSLPIAPVPWERLRAIPEIGGLIRALPTPALALVAPGDVEKLQAALQARGIGLQTATLSAEQLGGLPLDFGASDPLSRVLLVRDVVDADAGLGEEIDLDALAAFINPAAFLQNGGWGRKPRRGR